MHSSGEAHVNPPPLDGHQPGREPVLWWTRSRRTSSSIRIPWSRTHNRMNSETSSRASLARLDAWYVRAKRGKATAAQRSQIKDTSKRKCHPSQPTWIRTIQDEGKRLSQHRGAEGDPLPSDHHNDKDEAAQGFPIFHNHTLVRHRGPE